MLPVLTYLRKSRKSDHLVTTSLQIKLAKTIMTYNTFRNLPEDKQTRVMDAAAEEFAEHGFHQASVNRMVKTLGIAKGSLFKYFGTKEGLFEALFDRSLGQVKKSLRVAIDESDNDAGNFFARIRSVMLAGLAFIDTHPRLYRIYLKLLFQENAPLRGKLISTVRASTRNFLRSLILQGIKNGDLRSDLDVDVSVFVLESLLERFLQGARVPGIDNTLYDVTGDDAKKQIDQILRHLKTGFAPEQAA